MGEIYIPKYNNFIKLAVGTVATESATTVKLHLFLFSPRLIVSSLCLSVFCNRWNSHLCFFWKIKETLEDLSLVDGFGETENERLLLIHQILHISNYLTSYLF